VTLLDRIGAAAFQRKRWELLLAGVLLLVLAQGWPGIAVLGWVAPIPWLHFLRHNPRRRHVLALAAAWLSAWAVVAGSAASTGWPLAPALTFGTLTLASLLLWSAVMRRTGPNEALLAHGLLMAASTCAAEALPLAPAAAAWAATGIAPLERLAALLGAPAMAFLMHWTAATIEGSWETVHPAAMQHHRQAWCVVVVLALVAGAASDAAPAVPAAVGTAASAGIIAAGLGLLLALERQRRRAWARARQRAAPLDNW
jgi:hypothetical protein